VPDWLPGRALYHVHALGAAGVARANPDVDAPSPSDRGLRVLTAWLDHVAALGCGGVLLTPIFVSSTHGYDTVDPFRIDQRLGDDADFDTFVDACRARDLRLVLDGVFHHVGRAFGPFRDVVEHRAASHYAEWFRLDFTRDDADGFGYGCFEGHRELVALNHHSDAVAQWASAVARHWLGRGADGWRLDVAYALPPAFVASLVASVRGEFPDAALFGEMIHGDYARFVDESHLDAVTQYELYKAIWSALNDANFFELRWALERHRRCVERFAPVTFLGNHDVTRLASRLQDPRHVAHAVALLGTLPGVPCVYYGDELGWLGVKGDGPAADDALRPPLPASSEAGSDDAGGFFAWHRDLLEFRRHRPWLTRADVELLEVANRRVTYRVFTGTHAVLVALDVDGNAGVPPGWHAVLVRPGVAVCEPA
jgi:cyclomaltodextrinase